MTASAGIALVGDFREDVLAHRCVPNALRLAAAAEGRTIEWHWLPTAELETEAGQISRFAAVWVVPASPYANPTGVLAAIRFAREHPLPFLGTCGGFQHALLEFARNGAGLHRATHDECDPGGPEPVVRALSCSLVEGEGRVRFVRGSRLHCIYGRDTEQVAYHCRYGFNSEYRQRLERAGIVFAASDDAGEVRGFEVPSHPFFIGTLYQPERSALRGQAHPLIRAFVRASLPL
jgi:CTP synthase (UTP-ammonia lyase)